MMDVETVIEKNINLAINFIDINDIDLNFESVRNEAFKNNLHILFQKLKDEPNLDSRTETFDEVRSIINLDSPATNWIIAKTPPSFREDNKIIYSLLNELLNISFKSFR